MNGHIPGADFAFNPIADAGPAGGGAGANPNPYASQKRVNVSYKGSGFDTLTAVPTGHISSIPERRRPSLFMGNLLEVEDGMGQIPPGETAVNGTFKNQPTTGPQKSVFLTYQSGNETFYNCRAPIKINIPGGDFGLYKVTVNEVLFRNDATLLDQSDWICFNGKYTITAQLRVIDNNDNVIASKDIPIPVEDIGNYRYYRFNLFEGENYEFTMLTTQRFIVILNAALTKNNKNILTRADTRITREEIGVINVNNNNYQLTDNFVDVGEITENNLLRVLNNQVSPQGIYIFASTNPDRTRVKPLSRNITLTNTNNPADILNATIDFAVTGDITMTASDHIRNILPPLLTTQEISCIKRINIDRNLNLTEKDIICFDFPWLNFAGPAVFMLNTNAQTTCPIANDSASQFKTCALSYNTDIQPGQLVQMTSNIPLVLKEGSDFRISLSDIYGNPIKIKSPMYVQVTISPFSNQNMAELISQI